MLPQAAICFDPFHVIRMANRALDEVYMASRHGADGTLSGRQWRTARYALRAGVERLSHQHHLLLNQFRRSRYRLWRAWELKEDLRDLYRHVPADQARAYLRRWLAAASRSRIPAFVNLARRLRIYFDGVIAAVELGLSNSRLEGINAKIRLIQRRGYGHRSVKSLAAMIYLCIGGIVIDLPGRSGSVPPLSSGP
jgi:transposase